MFMAKTQKDISAYLILTKFLNNNVPMTEKNSGNECGKLNKNNNQNVTGSLQ